MSFDAVIIGGGLIGGACADTLAGEGLKVCLLDAGRPAREASWAGAGILHPIHPWQYPAPLQTLLRAGVAKHPEIAADLLERTGIDVEWEQTGLLVMDSEIGRLESWCGPGSGARRVDARTHDPAIQVDGPALFIPEAASVKNQRLARAFLEGARRRGAALRFGTPATRILADGVETPSGVIHADKIVVAAGAWAAKLLPELSVEPVRGQILLFENNLNSRLRHMVIFPDGEYAVPRRDGRVLFGSTLEKAGFEPRPTREAVRDLSERAEALLGLDSGRLLAAWAGLRPGTPHLRPYIGKHKDRPNVVLACGHYRNGILLAPLTGEIVRDVLLERQPRFDLDSFGV
ncbi:MAG: FAD-dependent oxidoreductase [Planctomycetota bacterium]